jgi:hydrogenase maturation factor
MLEAGKLPPELMTEMLSLLGSNDPRVLVGPRVGEDCAVIEMGERLLIAKSDPVTFAADRIGWYAVQVNANDIACTGATPRWFLPTILLPVHVEEDDIRSIFRDIAEACRQLGVAVVGGHTEVSVGIPRSIVAGTMLGELEISANLVSTSGAQDGDSIIVTAGLAIEGTAILARECVDAISAVGVDDDTVARAANYLHQPGISVLRAARALCEAVSPNSLHDITEGGVITALREVAAASGLGLVVESESMPWLPESLVICEALGIDPLGLLGSGALIATLPASDVPRALRALDAVGVSGWEVGQMMEASDGLWLIDRTGELPLPEFARDELARYLQEAAGTP